MRSIAIAAILIALAGCKATADRTATEFVKTNKVDFLRFEHDVVYRNASPSPSRMEAERLAVFLQDIRIDPSDAILVTGGAPEQRKALRVQFVRRGLVSQETGVNGAPGRVRVAVERYVVTPPSCPDWSKPVGEDFQNTPQANFGCANTANLGMMVANPRDLIRGRSPGSSDGAAVSAAIRRYRDGKIRQLIDDDGVTVFAGTDK
jgi:pilus assembly protein CpaD